MTRRASCSCNQLNVTCTGEPVRISVCHCLACQQRTGSAFGVQARWHRDHVTITGDATEYRRTGDEGSTATFRFCPRCGSTVMWTNDNQPELVAVAVGAFADPSFPAPKFTVYEARSHSWVSITGDVERWD